MFITCWASWSRNPWRDIRDEVTVWAWSRICPGQPHLPPLAHPGRGQSGSGDRTSRNPQRPNHHLHQRPCLFIIINIVSKCIHFSAVYLVLFQICILLHFFAENWSFLFSFIPFLFCRKILVHFYNGGGKEGIYFGNKSFSNFSIKSRLKVTLRYSKITQSEIRGSLPPNKNSMTKYKLCLPFFVFSNFTSGFKGTLQKSRHLTVGSHKNTVHYIMSTRQQCHGEFKQLGVSWL